MAKKSNSGNSIPDWLQAVLTIIGVFVFATVVTTLLAYTKWKRADHLSAQMFKATAENQPSAQNEITLDDNSAAEDDDSLSQGTISFQGKKYKYNDNLINILLLGIDDKGDYEDESEDVTVPFQTDTVVLGTIDALKKEITFLNIPRDTVAQIQVLDFNDEVATTEYGPIAIQHSYGNQGDKTNEVTVQTVSNLLYNVPINRYATVSLTAIPDVNDSVGGVTVEVLEDLTNWDSELEIGNTVTLSNEQAVIYTCRRDVSIDDSAMGRISRQAQYIRNLFPAVKAKTKENITFPIKLYNSLSDKVSTNMDSDEITYLAKLLLDLALDSDSIETIPGTMREIEPGEYDGYTDIMGYVVDEDALRQMIIDRYYIPVD